MASGDPVYYSQTVKNELAANAAASAANAALIAAIQPFPIGAVFLSVVSTNPATLLGYGTWSLIGSGKVLVGVDPADPDFSTAEKTGGEKTHTLTASEMPSHSHSVTDPGHTHTQDAHNHGVTDPGHSHTEQLQGGSIGSATGTFIMASVASGGSLRDAAETTEPATTGIAINNATATNQSATTGISVGSAGSGAAHNNMPPFIAVYIWKRTA